MYDVASWVCHYWAIFPHALRHESHQPAKHPHSPTRAGCAAEMDTQGLQADRHLWRDPLPHPPPGLWYSRRVGYSALSHRPRGKFDSFLHHLQPPTTLTTRQDPWPHHLHRCHSRCRAVLLLQACCAHSRRPHPGKQPSDPVVTRLQPRVPASVGALVLHRHNGIRRLEQCDIVLDKGSGEL